MTRFADPLVCVARDLRFPEGSSGRGLRYAVAWPWPGLRLNFAR